MNGRETNRNRSAEQTNAKHARQPNQEMIEMQTDVRRPMSKIHFKQQRRQQRQRHNVD